MQQIEVRVFSVDVQGDRLKSIEVQVVEAFMELVVIEPGRILLPTRLGVQQAEL